jgi:nucleotide-binding universal stress UspA family protein
VGPGPIVIALSATPDCVAAFRFAQALGARYDRPLLAVNVSAPPNVIGTSPEAGIAWEPFPLSQSQLDELEQSHSESLRQWCAEHDLQLPPRLHMGYGPPATVIEQVADRHDACMIVCGTRQLGLGQRIFNSSTATDLAAHSARPVLVVPTPSP